MAPSISSAVGNLLQTLTNIGASLLNAVFAVLQAIIALAQEFVTSVLQLAQALVAFVVDLSQSVVGFVIGESVKGHVELVLMWWATQRTSLASCLLVGGTTCILTVMARTPAVPRGVLEG